MSGKYGNFLGSFLTAIGEATELFEWPLEYSEGWRKKQLNFRDRKKYYNAVSYAKGKGLIKEINKSGKKFLQLTAKGELQQLAAKMGVVKQRVWDCKWRMLVFDIPEVARDRRSHLRWLLKKNHFVKLQQSVFINPYPLNREALDYLSQTGLKNYIRIIKVEEIDDDRDLKKKFDLK